VLNLSILKLRTIVFGSLATDILPKPTSAATRVSMVNALLESFSNPC
jgi:hypothetical protein